MRRFRTAMFLIASTLMLLLPRIASAQTGIAGVVTDSTGGVLPGVTVEAASPVLIEKVRTAVTDSRGRYDIVNLRPGAYTVTFTLPGFSAVRREGIDLSVDNTATVNAELRVGTLEETVTVSSAAPLVDMRNATRTQVIDRALLDELPSQRTLFGAGGTIPGIKMVTPDVGGQRMMQHSAGALQVHGLSGGDNAIQIDGLLVNTQQSDGSVQMYFNDSMNDEVSYQTSAVGAEVSHGGLRQNMIPRQGGNTFSGSSYVAGTPGRWINNALPTGPGYKGLAFPTSIQKLYDFNVGLGGPIARNKIWFFASYQERSANDIVANVYDEFTGTQAVLDQWIRNPSIRLTYQATPKNKLTGYYDRAIKHKGHDSGFGTEFPTASQRRPWNNGLYYVGQGKWTSTVSNRVLLEVGHSQVFEDHTITCQPGVNKVRGTPEWYASASRVDLDKGTTTTSCNGGHHPEYPRRFVESAALSHVTGSHNVKVGMQWSWGSERQGRNENADLQQQYKSGKPDSVAIAMSPVLDDVKVTADRGIFAQDAWTLSRLTLNLGIRFEHFNSKRPELFKPEGRFAPARLFPEVKNLPNWNDVAPRFGIVYDLTGDGKTAIKGGVNKYMRQWSSGWARRYSPLLYTGSDVRNWTDVNSNDIADWTAGCTYPSLGCEIGPSNNQNFGIAVTRRPAADIQREYTIEYSALVQREVFKGVSVTAGWFRRVWYDLERQDNQLVDVSDFAAIPTANPLPGSTETFTLYNLDKSKQGLVDLLDTTSKKDGRTYDGIELNGTARLPNGATIFGGWSTERTVTTLCEFDDPNKFRFCDQTGKLYQELGKNAKIPFGWDGKLSASYPLPRSVRVSMSFQTVAGAPLNVNWSVPASAFPGGRTQAVTVQLVSPATKFLERRSLLDLGVRRPFKFGRLQATAGFDVFNSLNSKAVLSRNQAFGASLDDAQTTLVGRMFRLSTNLAW
jgi:hypothetical protein